MMINERAYLLYLYRGFCFNINQVVLKLDAHEKILDSVLQGNIYLLTSILWIQKFNSSILMFLIFLLVFPQGSPEIWLLYIYISFLICTNLRITDLLEKIIWYDFVLVHLVVLKQLPQGNIYKILISHNSRDNDIQD